MIPAGALRRVAASFAAALRRAAEEGGRYMIASACALALDFAVYVALIRLAQLHYLVAAPLGFALGLSLVYVLSVRWVFRHRRFTDARFEFAVFGLIGIAGMALNQVAIYAGVAHLGLSYEAAKLVSVAVVFFFNYGSRKLLLFTRY